MSVFKWRICGSYLARDDERDGLDGRRGDLEGSGNLTICHVEGTPWQEAHPALWIRRLVFRELVQIVGFVLVRANISVSEKKDQRRTRMK